MAQTTSAVLTSVVLAAELTWFGIRQGRRVATWKRQERLVATQALALMKKPQNQGTISRFCNEIFVPEQILRGAID